MNPSAVNVKDLEGKIPLIHACDQITVGFNQTKTKHPSKNDLMNEIYASLTLILFPSMLR